MAARRTLHDDDTLMRVAGMAAQQAVEKTFTTLGIDISTPEAVIEAQGHFQFLRTFRGNVTVFKNRAIQTAAALAVGGVAAAIVAYKNTSAPPL